MSERVQIRSPRRIACLVALAGLVAMAAFSSAPSSASAACPVTPGVFTTSWVGGSGHYNTDANWTNGAPSGSCDASIIAAGTYTVLMTGGSVAKSMTIGGAGSNPTLQISAEGPNTNLNVAAGGQLIIASGAGITLKCNVTPSSCGSPSIGAPTITNAGTITVDADVNADVSSTPFISGPLTNTGTMQFNHGAKFNNGAVTNQGTVNIADGTILRSGGSSCGDTGVSFKNDTGGTLNAAGAGTFDVINYEQGNGPTTGSSPVQIPCGSLKYTGNGASKVRAYGGFQLTGTMQSNQSLTVSDESSNTNASLGGAFTNNGAITLTCSIPCGAGGGPDLNAAGNTFTNAGTLTVAAAAGTGSVIDSGGGGTIVNTGTMNFDQSASLSGVISNQGAVNVADTKTAFNHGSSCGDTGAKFTNGSGGSVNGTGSGALSTFNYEQGAGTTTGTAPVRIPCGTVKYLGNGASTVQARGGFTLSGTIQAGQTLEISGADNNATAHVSGGLINNGTVLFTCPLTGCAGGAGGGPSWNGAGNAVVNAGTMTVAASSGTGTGIGTGGGGTLTNTGTMQFNQSSGLGGVVVNKGAINIAAAKTVTSSGSSCGDAGGSVKNDTGGSINATGTGTFNIFTNYEQGNGTTSGTTPVNIPCGGLKYTGTGASTVQAGGTTMTGNINSGQTLRILTNVNSPAFSNAGTIVFDQSATGPSLNLGGTLTNTGTIATSGASVNTSTVSGGSIDQTGASAQVIVSAGTNLNLSGNSLLLKAGRLTGGGTLTGSVNNSGGTVAPGASPGTLTLSGNYTQGAGGSLEIEVEGAGAGQFDRLTVGGNATLGGTLALQPTPGYVAAAVPGDSMELLAYGGARTDKFASTTVNPPPKCQDAFTTVYEDGAKKVSLVVANSGANCGDPNPPQTPPVTPPAGPPDTVLGSHPKAKVKTKKRKAKVKFTFSATVAGATFKCKLDKGAYMPCASPKSFKVKPGRHRFSVQAVGPGGVVDPTPASFSFKVVKKKARR